MRKLLTVLLILSLLMVCVVPCYSQGGRDYQARVLTVSRWIDLSGRMFNRVVPIFTDGDATPSVYISNAFKTGNTAPITITTFDSSITGQWLVILFGDADTTIDFSGTNLLGNGGVDWTAASGDMLYGLYDGTNWYCEVSNPSVISGDLTVTGSLIIGTSTKHDGYVINDAAELQTGEVAQEHIKTFTLVDNNVYVFTAIVAAFEDGVNRAGYEIKVVAYRDGGGATLQGGVVSVITSESEAAWDVTFTVNGNNIRVSVTGEASTTIEWGCTLIGVNIGP